MNACYPFNSSFFSSWCSYVPFFILRIRSFHRLQNSIYVLSWFFPAEKQWPRLQLGSAAKNRYSYIISASFQVPECHANEKKNNTSFTFWIMEFLVDYWLSVDGARSLVERTINNFSFCSLELISIWSINYESCYTLYRSNQKRKQKHPTHCNHQKAPE